MPQTILNIKYLIVVGFPVFTVNVWQVYFYFIQSQSYAGELCTNPDFLLFYGQSDSSVNEENGHQQQVSSGGGTAESRLS